MRSMSFLKSVGIIIGIFGLVMLPMVSLGAEITLKLGHVWPPNTTNDVASHRLAELVAANTKGKVEIKVFGNSQFGNLQEHWAQVKTGAIDVFVQDVSAAFMVEADPKNFIIMIFPYLFDSQEHYHKFCGSDLLRSMMAKVEKANNLKYLGYLGDRPPRGFSTTSKRVSIPDEIRGLKLRVPEVPPFVAAYKAWGANPTPIAAKEIYTSLKSGLVEGMDNDLTGIYHGKFHEIQKFYTSIDYMRSGLGYWINAKKWESLPADVQTAFLKAGPEIATYVNGFTAQQVGEAEKGFKQAGVEVIRPDLRSWKEIAEKEVLKNDGKLWEKGLYEKIKGMK